MLIMIMILGSFLGMGAALVSYFALGLGLFAAFGLYVLVSILPALITVALTAGQLAFNAATRDELAAR